VTNQSGSDAEWTYVKWGMWYLMTDNLRQVTKVHRKQGRRQVSRKPSLKSEHAAGWPPNVNINTRVIERAKEAQALYMIHVEMCKKNVDPRGCQRNLLCQSADAGSSVQDQ
jgi:hypothetical protein